MECTPLGSCPPEYLPQDVLGTCYCIPIH
jgi:hypothetical protein